jgi:xanthine/uracil permease
MKLSAGFLFVTLAMLLQVLRYLYQSSVLTVVTGSSFLSVATRVDAKRKKSAVNEKGLLDF